MENLNITEKACSDLKPRECDHVGCDHVGCDHVGCDHVGCDHVGCDHVRREIIHGRFFIPLNGEVVKTVRLNSKICYPCIKTLINSQNWHTSMRHYKDTL